MESPSFQPTLFDRIFIKIFHIINIFVPWHKLPGFLGAINLDFIRVELRANNLHDGYASGVAQGNTIDHPLVDQRFLNARNSDGKFNSLELPLMGCSGMRFGRNFSRKYTRKPTEAELWSPNPRLVSERFMARGPGGFIAATTLNLLAAAWIQFQTHDWFVHESVRSPIHFHSFRGVCFLKLPLLLLTQDKRATKPTIFRFRQGINGPLVPWCCRAPNRMRYLTYLTLSAPDIKTTTRRGGMARRSTAQAKLSQRPCDPHTGMESCYSRKQKKAGKCFCPAIAKGILRLGSTTTGGLAWKCCTRFLQWSTMPYVTCFAPHILTGLGELTHESQKNWNLTESTEMRSLRRLA
jgi:hypothetical protein